MPCFSSTLSSSRSVSSTPSSSALKRAASSAWRSSGPPASSTRRILSATPRISRANDAIAYWRASATSRSVRLRRFSISASARRSLSLSSAASRTIARPDSEGGAGGLFCGLRFGLRGGFLGGASVRVRHRAVPLGGVRRPGYQGLAMKNQAVGQYAEPRQVPAERSPRQQLPERLWRCSPPSE